MDSQTYRPAPMSVGLAVMTGVIVALGVIGLAAVPLLISRGEGALALIVAFLWLVILICWQARPKWYEIGRDALVIVRSFPFRDVVIPLTDIRDAKTARVGALMLWKIYGINGLFSNTGWFRSREFGKFFASITDGNKVVMLSNGKKYAISPKYPDEFVADLKRIINQV